MIDQYGKIFKEIRLNKGMSIEKLSDYSNNLSVENSISKSGISKFENENSNISLPRLSNLLNVLNMSIEEFAMYAQEIENPMGNDLNDIATAFKKEEIHSLHFLSKSYKLHADIIPRNKHMYIFCEALIKRLNNGTIDNGLIDEIIKYLQNIDHWHFYELTLFTNTMFLFEPEIIDFLLSRASKRMNEYKRLSYHYDYEAIMLSNAVTYFLEINHLAYANKYLGVLGKYLQKNPRAVFEKLRFRFLLGLNTFKSEDTNKGISMMKEVISQLKSLDLEEDAIRFEHYLKNQLLKKDS